MVAVDGALVRERCQGSHAHVVSMDLEELAELLAAVASAPAVGPQRAIATALRQEGADLLGVEPLVVRRGDDGAARFVSCRSTKLIFSSSPGWRVFSARRPVRRGRAR